MPDHVVTDEKGQVHRFPEEATPEMIAQALGVQPPSAPALNLQTGQGMEQQAVQQSRQQIAAPVLQAAQEHENRQALLAKRQNRALNSPTPFSNAIAAYAPVAAARSIAGAKLGSAAGERIAPWLSNSPEASQWASLIGGLVGGTAASYKPGGPTKGVQRITRGPGGTRDVSLSPLTIAGRELENVVPRQPAPTDTPGSSGGALPAADEFYSQRGAEINKIRKMQPQPLPWETPTQGPPATQPTAEDFYSNRAEDLMKRPDELTQAVKSGTANRISNRVPTEARGDPFNPTQPPAQTPFTAPMEAQSAEGVKGSVPKPSGRLVLLPQEAQAQDQLQAIAKTRASQHGLQYAAGMRPAGGGRVPMTPTGTTTTEFPGPRVEPQAKMPWETQGINVTAPPLKVENAMGIRWANDGVNKVSIPDTVPDEGIEAYARPKLAEQAQIRANMPWMKGPQ